MQAKWKTKLMCDLEAGMERLEELDDEHTTALKELDVDCDGWERELEAVTQIRAAITHYSRAIDAVSDIEI